MADHVHRELKVPDASSSSSEPVKVYPIEDSTILNNPNGVEMSTQSDPRARYGVSNAGMIGEEQNSSESSSSFKTAATGRASSRRSSSDYEADKYDLISKYLPNYYQRHAAYVTDDDDDDDGSPAISGHEFGLCPDPMEHGKHHPGASCGTSPLATSSFDVPTGYCLPELSPREQDNSSFKVYVDEPNVIADNLARLNLHRDVSQGASLSLRPALQNLTNIGQVFRTPETTIDYKQRIHGLFSDESRPVHSEASKPATFHPMSTKPGFRLLPFRDSPQPSNVQFAPQNEAYQKMLLGFSPNYEGNIHIPRNRSANIPDSENCALFILGLPPTITTTELLATVRDCGRVYASHINAPEPDKGHSNCAAKIIFFERRGAERFYDRYMIPGLTIPGYPGHRARVTWNRIKSAEQDHPKHYSRVLLIAGPASFVDPAFLTSYFKTKIDFEIDQILNCGALGDRRLIEYRFGSFRCQAESAKMALSREMARHEVQVWFGPDPCDVVSADTESTSARGGSGTPIPQEWLGEVKQAHPARLSANWRETMAAQAQLR